MSRYVLELNSDIIKNIVAFGMMGETGVSTIFKIDELEELNSDYINEHFSDLQDTAYQKGFEDGKWKSEDGCTGCEYEGKTGEHLPCEYCKNNFRPQWTAKADKIGVGDVVETKSGTIFAVTKITTDGFVVGFTGDGSTCCFNNIIIYLFL